MRSRERMGQATAAPFLESSSDEGAKRFLAVLYGRANQERPTRGIAPNPTHPNGERMFPKGGVCLPFTRRYTMNKTFNVPATFGVGHPGHHIVGYADDSNPHIPVRKDYSFRPELLREVIAYLAEPAGDGLMLTGPTGAGKTSLILQVAARLNWPVQSVTCHGRLTLADLRGLYTVQFGDTVFLHGPLSTAVRDGHILILNEMDMMDPAELVGINDVVEGQPLIIEENGGEVIKPHPMFRLIATGNSAGAGDTTALYQGVMRQNLAFMDRFRVSLVDYPDQAIEVDIIQQAVPKCSMEVIGKMVAVANEVRRLFVGDPDTGEAALTITMSTRTLVRWARLSIDFKKAPHPIKYALEQALTNRAEAKQREAIHQIGLSVFGGQLWDPNQQEVDV